MRRTWTRKEIDLVAKWQAQGVPGIEQAKRLNRSYASLHCAIHRYKDRFKIPEYPQNEVRNHQTPDRCIVIIDCLNSGMNQADIAKKLNYSKSSVSRLVRGMIADGIIIRKARQQYAISKKWLKDC